MKLTSNIIGVYFAPSHNTWFARDQHKKNLYRGPSQALAEKARLEYDAEREVKKQTRVTHREMFAMAFQPTWPPSRVR